MIIMNPSKAFREVYTESLIESNLKDENEPKDNSLFKRFIMYAGSKLFMNNKSENEEIDK